MQAVYDLQHGAAIDLREIPSAVGGSEKSRHGLILAKSPVAKKYGIQTAMTIRDALQLCPDLVIVPPRYDIYVRASKMMMSIMREYSPFVEPYSIDECWISFEGMGLMYDDYIKLAHELKDRIKRELGFSINVGISTNKLLSKMASDFKKPDQVHTLFPDEIETKMHPLDIRKLFGVGVATERKLRKYGINTIGELAHTDPEFLKYTLKSYGMLLFNYAWGRDTSIVNDVKYTYVKSIGNSTTISYDVSEAEDAFKYIMSLSETVSMRLRGLGQRANLVSIALKNTDFVVVRRQEKLQYSICSTNDIIKNVKRLFLLLWDGNPIRHIEVRVGMLVDPFPQQLNFFEQADEKSERVDEVIDTIRTRFGNNSIIRAGLLYSGARNMLGGTSSEDYPQMRGIL